MTFRIFCAKTASRSPHGERGLKCQHDWGLTYRPGRSPHGERGLKLDRAAEKPSDIGRSPHGERGLKCCERFLKWLNMVALLMESVD